MGPRIAPFSTLYILFLLLLLLATPSTAAGMRIFNQDGNCYSGPIAGRPLGKSIEMKRYAAWPSGFTLPSDAFNGAVYDGQFIWLIPERADRVIKIDTDTGAMTAYDSWPPGFHKSDIQTFGGGVFDGQSIWLIPYDANMVVKVDKDTGVMTGYSWLSSLGLSGIFDGQYIWIFPTGPFDVIRVDKDTHNITSYSSWPSCMQNYVGPFAFMGTVFDGRSIWLIPNDAPCVVKIDTSSGEMTGYSSWPKGLTGFGNALMNGGVFDGKNIWMFPCNGNLIVKIDKDSGSMVGYDSWPPGFTKSYCSFAGSVFDGKSIWLMPYYPNNNKKINYSVVRLDKDSGSMTSYNSWPPGFNWSTYYGMFSGSVFDGQSIWLIPDTANSVIRLLKN